jgi:serine phosphatase RsbU (regulator of sigma subunit)
VIADEIYRSVCEFRDGSAVDDITVLVVRFGGRPA